MKLEAEEMKPNENSSSHRDINCEKLKEIGHFQLIFLKFLNISGKYMWNLGIFGRQKLSLFGILTLLPRQMKTINDGLVQDAPDFM